MRGTRVGATDRPSWLVNASSAFGIDLNMAS
jgi:hypothetical protein